jgi:hypothetical protein
MRSGRGHQKKSREIFFCERLLRAITGPLKRSTSISVTSSRFRRFREGPNHA